MDDNQQVTVQPEGDAKETYQGPRGIGGWLGFFVFNVIASMLACIVRVIIIIPEIDAYAQYGYLWAVLLDLLYFAVIFSLFLIILIFIFKKNILFRLFFLILVGFDFLYFVFTTILSVLSNVDLAQTLDSGIAVIFIKNILFIVYLFNSKRVKYTFIVKDEEPLKQDGSGL